MSYRRDYTNATLKRLFLASSGFCCFPNCNTHLMIPATPNDPEHLLAKIAHIHDLNPGGDRYLESLSPKERNEPSNLLLLCPSHHDIVDGQSASYPAEQLKKWKQDDLDRWFQMLERAVPSVNFSELKTVSNAIVNSPILDTSNMDLTPVEEKIRINGLSATSIRLIRVGYQLQSEVSRFLSEFDMMSPGFQESVRSGFLKMYDDLATTTKLEDDALFQEMAAKVQKINGDSSLTMQVAQLGVMVYYFEKCDIFKR